MNYCSLSQVITKPMFDFFNNFLATNNNIYRDLHIINMALKKETIEKEMKQMSNPWKIKEVSNKACQTMSTKTRSKACQTAPLVPKSLSQALMNHIETQTAFDRYLTAPCNSSSSDTDSVDSQDSVDTIDMHDEFIMLDA